MDITLDDGITIFNPGKFFGLYLSLLPPEATKEGCKGGYLFQRPKSKCKTFNCHDPNMVTLYEANSKGGWGGGANFIFWGKFCFDAKVLNEPTNFSFPSWKVDLRAVPSNPLQDGQEEQVYQPSDQVPIQLGHFKKKI